MLFAVAEELFQKVQPNIAFPPGVYITWSTEDAEGQVTQTIEGDRFGRFIGAKFRIIYANPPREGCPKATALEYAGMGWRVLSW